MKEEAEHDGGSQGSETGESEEEADDKEVSPARDQIKVKRLTQVVPPPFTGRGLLGDTAEAETGGSEEIRGARVVKKIQVLERRRKEE